MLYHISSILHWNRRTFFFFFPDKWLLLVLFCHIRFSPLFLPVKFFVLPDCHFMCLFSLLPSFVSFTCPLYLPPREKSRCWLVYKVKDTMLGLTLETSLLVPSTCFAFDNLTMWWLILWVNLTGLGDAQIRGETLFLSVCVWGYF